MESGFIGVLEVEGGFGEGLGVVGAGEEGYGRYCTSGNEEDRASHFGMWIQLQRAYGLLISLQP